MIATRQAKRITEKFTYEEFLVKYTGTHAEWLDDEVLILPSASNRHQNILTWLLTILTIFIETYDLGLLLPVPFNMQLPSLGRGREPDILFVAQNRLNIVQDTNLSDAADLVIEIISPESIGRDRGEKFVECEAAGVHEYWLIDPDRQQAEFYQLAEAGRYHLSALDDKGRFHSTILPHFWLQVDWLWQEPLPKVLDVARQLGVLDQ
ncbi:MAG: Uma2 family endonuclease [Anaerolineae bacterium]|nr:Uma2 family endonuclease [Anaerolineae bacterium]